MGKEKIFNVIFREKPDLMLVELSNAKGEIYASSLAKKIDCTYSHVVKILQEMQNAGIVSFDKQGKLVPTEARSIADVSGAGDTVITVATACLATGASPEDMTLVANLAGGLVCGKVGVVPVDRDQLLEETLLLFKSGK